jgi:tubulin delta
MEPKVVNACLLPTFAQNWKYNPVYSFYKQEGSGNNWAFGYNVHGPNCEETIFKKICTLAERMESLKGILVFQSMAGGTGSGVGSFLVEKLREYFGNVKIVCIAVLPHLTGKMWNGGELTTVLRGILFF